MHYEYDKILSLSDFKQIQNLSLTHDIKSFTIDVETLFYTMPPEPVPEYGYCRMCHQRTVHLPSCKYQKTNDLVNLTLAGYLVYKFPLNDVQFIDDHLRVSSLSPTPIELEYVTTISYENRYEHVQKKNAVGRPKKQKDLKQTRFNNHVLISLRNTSVKLNKTHALFTSLPTTHDTFHTLINTFVDQLKRECGIHLDMPSLFINVVNYQLELPTRLNLEPIYSIKLRTSLLTTTVQKLLPIGTTLVSLAKAVVTTVVDESSKHLKYSFTVFDSGIIQIFISQCTKRDLSIRKCIDTSPQNTFFFDIDTFQLTSDVVDNITTIVQHVQRLSKNIEAPNIIKKLNKKYSARVDGKLSSFPCKKTHTPYPYSFYGNCPNPSHYVNLTTDYPCCTLLNPNIRRSYFKNDVQHSYLSPRKTGILRGTIQPGGIAYLNKYPVPLLKVDTKYLYLTNKQKYARHLFDREYIHTHGLKHYTLAELISIIDDVYQRYCILFSISMTDEQTVSSIITSHSLSITSIFDYSYTHTIPMTVSKQEYRYLPSTAILCGALLLPNQVMYIFDMYNNVKKTSHSFSLLQLELHQGIYYQQQFIPLSECKQDSPETDRILYQQSIWYTPRAQTIIIPFHVHSSTQLGSRTHKTIKINKSPFQKKEWVLFQYLNKMWFYIIRHLKEPIYLKDNVIESYTIAHH
jgi:hypothetical protein